MKRLCFTVLSILASVTLTSCARFNGSSDSEPTGAIQESSAQIIKSPNDDRDYRYLVLENGLKVLLISDPETDKAAAAIDVNVGNWHDPKDRAGLAHFVEHMLFIQSEKYPKIDGYKHFVEDHGGGSNAYTSDLNTNYHFSVNSDSLRESLDRFAYSIGQPILSEEYVERERNAIESEYRLKFKSDSRRGRAISGATSNPDHPYLKFGVGSLDTLDNKAGKLLQDVKSFYENYYVAGNMSAVVYGKESLLTLEAWARESFSIFPEGNVPELNLDEPVFLPGQRGVRINFEPIKDNRYLTLNFPQPPAQQFYDESPMYLLGFYLGDEASGSLHSLLKEEGLIESLEAYTSGIGNYLSEFSIGIELTDDGYNQIDKIVALVFDHIDLVRREGIKREHFDEAAVMADLSFRFAQKGSAYSLAKALSYRLNHYPPHRVVDVGYGFKHFDEGLIREYLENLTVENLRMYVAAKDQSFDRVEPFYDVRYSIEALDNKLMKRLENPQIQPELSLPQSNPYIPESVELYSMEKEGQTVPELLLEKPGLRVWHLQDATFHVPTSNIHMKFSSPLASDSAASVMKRQILFGMVARQINKYFYPAGYAGLWGTISGTSEGVYLGMSGYSDKQPVLLEMLVSGWETVELTEVDFRRQKKKLKKDLENYSLSKPMTQVSYSFRDTLNPRMYSDKQELAALKNIKLEDIRQFKNQLLSEAHLEVFAHGNVTREHTLAMADTASRLIDRPGSSVRTSVYDLSNVDTLLIPLEVDHTDSVSFLYFQGSENSRTANAQFSLLADLLGPEFFTELRTNQQLGYSVSARSYHVNDRPGLTFMVQSSVAGPDELNSKIYEFLHDQLAVIQQVEQEKLDTLKESLLHRLAAKDRNLGERSNRYWRAILDEDYDFQETKLLAEAVNSVTKEQLIHLFKKSVLADGALSLEVHSVGTNDQTGYSNIKKADKVLCLESCLDDQKVPLI